MASKRELTLLYRQDILSGPILPILIKLSLPGIFSLILQSSFNLVDRWFVSQIDQASLGSIGIAFVFQSLILAIGGGFATGLRSLVARLAGADKAEEIPFLTTLSFFILGVFSLLLSLLLSLLIPLILQVMALDPLLQEGVLSYIKIILYGSIFTLFSLSGNGVLRSVGAMKAPLYIMIVSTLMNLILDPLFIFGWKLFPPLGIKGAALATVISRGVGVVILFYTLSKKGFFSKPKESWFSLYVREKSLLKKLFSIGGPAMVSRSLNALTMGLIYSLVTPYGLKATAAYTAAMTYQRVFMIPLNGLNGASITMVGQNGGAGNKGRILQIYLNSQGLVGCLLGILTLFVCLFTAPLLGFMGVEGEDPIYMLRILSFSYFFISSRILSQGALNSLGFSKETLLFSLFQKFVLSFGLGSLFSYLGGLRGLWFGISLGHIIAGIISFILFRYIYRHKELTL